MIEIIPAIDLIDGKCVRLSQGDYSRVTSYRADPADMARMMADAGLMRIHVVDLDGAKAGEPRNLRTLERIASVSGIRAEWGGGIKDDQALTDVFNAGAAYAVIGSVAARHPELMARWLDRRGGDRIILGADLRGGKVAVAGWLEESQAGVDDLLALFLPHGLSQSIVTEISRDGMMAGPDFDLYVRLQSSYPSVSFTVSGGISGMADIERAAELGLRRVIIGKALYEGAVTLASLSRFADR